MRSVTSFSSDIKCVRWAKRLKSNVKQWWLNNTVALELWSFQNVSPSPLTSRFTNPGHVIAFWWICKRHGPATFRTWHCSKMDGVTLCNTEISSFTSTCTKLKSSAISFYTSFVISFSSFPFCFLYSLLFYLFIPLYLPSFFSRISLILFMYISF